MLYGQQPSQSLAADIGLRWDAGPGFGAAEEGEEDVAAELQDVGTGGRDVSAVGVAGDGVVEMTVTEAMVVVVAEAGADGEAADLALTERRVGVVDVDGHGWVGRELHNPDADVGIACRAGLDANDGAYA